MEGGPPAFPADSSCPQVLRIPALILRFRLRDYHSLWSGFPSCSTTTRSILPVPTPAPLLALVWPLPLSLAATYRISFDFFSSAYLDVSLRRVPLVNLWIQLTIRASSARWFPNSDICGSMLICSSPQLIAACHVLLRLLMPRHSPYALISLNFLFELYVLFSVPLNCLNHNNCYVRIVSFFTFR